MTRILKQIGAIALVATTLSLAQAQTPPENPPSINVVMKEIGENFKALKQQLPNANLNVQSLALAKDLSDDVYLSMSLLPKTVEDADPSVKPVRTALFREIIGRLYVASIHLQQALLSNDNTAALTHFKAMDEIRKEGHTEFFPPHP